MSTEEQITPVTVVLPCMWGPDESVPEQFLRQMDSLVSYSCVARVLLVHADLTTALPAALAAHPANKAGALRFIQTSSWLAGSAIAALLENSETDILLLMPRNADVEIEVTGIKRFVSTAASTAAGLVYSNLRQIRGSEMIELHLIDYRPGSLRESFDFGDVLFISRAAAESVLDKYGSVDTSLHWAGLYDLRLKLATDFPILRIPEPLYTRRLPDPSTAKSKKKKKYFDFGDAKSQSYQLEFETIANAHLRRVGAYLNSETSPLPPPNGDFPVLVSVIMPVRDRIDTIAAAVDSALNQSASFPFNVIVVDDHSLDGTTEFLQERAKTHANLVHKIPQEIGLGIGGLLNEALYAPECGVYLVQLDSDDLYAGTDVLEKMLAKFWESTSVDNTFKQRNAPPHYALVIGAYTTVDFDLKETRQGVIHHPEFTTEEGRNTALRMDGLGAPRAYYVPVLRRFGFPNTSYGEDYAVCLRISREYNIGRLFESLYLRRRWDGNTDRSLPIGSIRSIDVREMLPPGTDNVAGFLSSLRPLLLPLMTATNNGYNSYKDWLRTVELQARMNHHH